MAELVEEGVHLVEGQQRRFRLGRLGEVHHQRHQRARLDALYHLRTAELGHPRTGALRRTREEIEVEHRYEVALRVGHLVSRHVGMIDGDVVAPGEIQPIELVGQQEDPFFHLLQFEVGLHLLVAQRILLVLVLLGVVRPVPRHHIALEALRMGIVVDHRIVGPRIVDRLVEQLLQEGVHRSGILGHALFEHIVGVGFISQQTCDLAAQIDDAADILAIVELAAQRTRIRRPPQLLLRLAVRRIGHEGDVARILQRHRPTLLSARLGVGRQPLLHEVGQLFDPPGIGDVEREGVGRSQRILTEFERHLSQLGRILPVELLLVGRKRRTVAGEALVGLLQQPFVLLRKEPAGILVDGLHAGEERRIERDVVAQRRQLGLHVERDALHLVVGIGFEQVVEQPLDSGKQFAGTFQRDDRIVERRLGGILHDGLDLGPLYGDGRIERRFVIFQFDPLERGRGIGRLPLREQRIRGIDLGQVGHGHRAIGTPCDQKRQ